MLPSYYPIIFGIIFFLSHYIGDKIHDNHRPKILLLSVGISLAYIFLYLMPEAITFNLNSAKLLPGFMLLGIMLSRVSEMHIRRHRSPATIKKELKNIHSTALFGYNLIVGMLIMEFSKIGVAAALLFFLPALFHSAAGSMSISGIHKSVTDSAPMKILLSSSTLLGIFIAGLFSLSAPIFGAILGLTIGVMLYSVMRDAVPWETVKNAQYFILGILLYALAIEAGMLFLA